MDPSEIGRAFHGAGADEHGFSGTLKMEVGFMK